MGCPECGGSETTIGYEESDREGFVYAVNRCIDPRCDTVTDTLIHTPDRGIEILERGKLTDDD